MRVFSCWLLVFSCWALGLEAQTLDVTRFGAIGDGKTLNTRALQAAIDSCAKQGGGTVLFPAGTFLTGTLNLRSNITLELSNGAVLLGSDNINDYSTEPRDNRRHLLYAHAASNIAIIGQGTIDGQGKGFWKGDTLDYEPLPERPVHWLRFVSCSRVQLRDVRLINSPSHTCFLDSCSDVTIDNVTLYNDPRVPNTDGFDISDCSHVRISNCLISTGDDGICLKGQGGRVENILVSNCVIESDDAALKLGTGSLGVMQNCIFSNCSIRNTRYGIALFMIEGGTHRNITFQNISIDGGSRHPYDYPIFVDLDRKDSSFALGTMENLSFHDISARTQGKILISGHPDKNITSISLRNITLEARNCAAMTKARKPKGNRNYKYESRIGNADFANAPALIALGYADKIQMENVRVRLMDSTANEKSMISSIGAASFSATGFVVEAQKLAGVSLKKPVITASKSNLFRVNNAELWTNAPALLECSEMLPKAVQARNNELSGAKEIVWKKK
ncbi:MAG: glycoside hydrolase family 28 protein [Candidatus Kapabacteria bacterium]|jgi:polygalacturonase|nr:glycoside hydrolase family 28 protein [Candidatus Kapabacteria bacterium]